MLLVSAQEDKLATGYRLVVSEHAHILVATTQDLSLSLSFVVLPKAAILCAAVFVLVDAITVALALAPLSCIQVPILAFVHSVCMLLILPKIP